MTTRTPTPVLIEAMLILARDIESGDGVANAAIHEAAERLDRLHRECEVFRAERDRARACFDNTVKILTSIHSLLYPAPMTLEDGRTMVFRPKSLDPHEVLQELSDRIRAVPDKLAQVERELKK